MRLNRFVVVPVLVLVIAGLVAGLLTGTFASVARSGLYATGLLSDGGASTVPPGLFSSPTTPASPSTATTPEPAPVGAPRAVLAPAQAGPAPRAAKLAARVSAIKLGARSGSFSGTVIDGGTGKVLYAKNASKAYIPASTLKLLTTTAALSILGPQHQFTTRVVSAGATRVVLVGGGDPYLTPAALKQLATLTAVQLKKSKRTTVQVGYDVSLFSGPSWHPDWPGKYRDQVTPISSLWVNEGRVGGSVGARVPNPPKTAATVFAAALRTQGIAVTAVKNTTATTSAPQLAAVRSMSLEQIVERLLMVSDNDAAEAVSRQAAIGAGKPGSFVAGRAVVKARLVELGVWDDSARIRDGSGLSRSNAVPADLMSAVLRLTLEDDHPELRAVVTGLPVAGVEGSLRRRFTEPGTAPAHGVVRGKTGTLTGVSALAGYLLTDDGSLLVYAFLVNGSTDYFGTRAWLDRVTNAVSTCGCH